MQVSFRLFQTCFTFFESPGLQVFVPKLEPHCIISPQDSCMSLAQWKGYSDGEHMMTQITSQE